MNWRDVFTNAKLTKGLDVNPDGTVTARWHRVKDGCEVSISFTMPNKPTIAPLEVWTEIGPLIARFVWLVAYGPTPMPDLGGEIVEGEVIELLPEPESFTSPTVTRPVTS